MTCDGGEAANGCSGKVQRLMYLISLSPLWRNSRSLARCPSTVGSIYRFLVSILVKMFLFHFEPRFLAGFRRLVSSLVV